MEDLWGAGAFIDAYRARHVPGRSATAASPGSPTAVAPAAAGPGTRFPGGLLSPEAGAALAAYRTVANGLGEALLGSGSGRELAGRGFAGDVAVAAEVAASRAVPVMRDGWYVDGGSAPSGTSG